MIDKIQVLFNSTFKITDTISIRHSTIGDVVNVGEELYYSILSTLTGIPSDAKSILWDMGYDWVEMSDLEYFAMTVKSMPSEHSSIFIPNTDFSKFSMYIKPDGEKVFANPETNQTIDFYVHKKILDTLCIIHGIKKKPEKPGDKLAREWMIEDDREKRKMNEAKKDKRKSTLAPLISSMVNHQGFKYNYQTVQDLPIGQFMDAVSRIQLITSAMQLAQGCYSGNIDMKKLDKKKLDWTREI